MRAGRYMEWVAHGYGALYIVETGCAMWRERGGMDVCASMLCLEHVPRGHYTCAVKWDTGHMACGTQFKNTGSIHGRLEGKRWKIRGGKAHANTAEGTGKKGRHLQ